MQWLRWWHGTVNDPKFAWVARKAETNVATVIAVWAALLEHASQESERGSVGGFDPESYDCTLGLEDGTTQRVIDAMRGKGLLEVDRIAMWESRQPKREDNSADRVARHRANKNVTQGNADVTHGNAPEKIREDKKKKEEGAAAPFVLPDGVDPKAWADWVEYRKASGKPLKPASLPAAAKQMAALGSRQAAAVQHSIANGYRGLFPPNGVAPQPPKKSPYHGCLD